ncbi:hypothetical protein COCCADRAFT_22423 [Bipolaris zeicola 26-R-13]|uniref:DUF7730 domain-containing protein n=1 Tax=Cochliobolus carbonum (strain 26-R-13) TaxID=930089 RepID=W6YF03_COCC2|nr:uncharacterized protein COCCADRAFT_22423 [Bipolaris zeicola 26-R-13]EUC38072.1 hypothetical protein COCCADRAFT_22423 [Bipolaris zeicola 26-R-13]
MYHGNTASPYSPALFRLPIELRRTIYSLVLPHTTTFDVRLQRSIDPPPKSEYNLTFVRQNGDGCWRMQRTLPRTDRETGNDIVWRRGCTALLAVSRQVHEEAADMLYGENTFVIDVTFSAINFRYRWRTANNLTPNQTYQFLDHFSQRNLLRIRNYIVNVESVDDYTGMIKYNYGGRGLSAGIHSKVRELVDLLVAVPQLHRLQVHLIDGAISRVKFPSGRVHRVQDESNISQTQLVLNPFRALHGVRMAVVSGVNDEYKEELEKSMTKERLQSV